MPVELHETTVAVTDMSSGPTDMDAEAEGPAAAAPTASQLDDGSWQGTVVRAGMRKCSVNRSHIFIIRGPGGEVEVRLVGVDSLHFGPVNQRAYDMANTMMSGKLVRVMPVEEDIFHITANVTLSDGRDMAEVLAANGLVQQDDGASTSVQEACKEAREKERGIYALI